MSPNLRCAATALSALLLLSACRDQPTADASGPDTGIAATPEAPEAPDTSVRERMDDPIGMHGSEQPARDTTPVDARIESVTFSNQGDTETNTIGPSTSVFDPLDTVYVEIHTRGSAPEYNLYAKWISADGEVLSDYGLRVNQGVDSRMLISLSKPDGLMSGENRVEVAINGQPPRVLTYRVR